MLEAIVEFVRSNPFLVFAILFIVYNKWKSSQPWPDFGGRITSVHNCAEWEELLRMSKGKVVVVDAYATWCPPCKAAAPKYARMSEEFGDNTVFTKFNTDEAKDLSRSLGISAMPTFKVFKDGKEVDSMRGFAGEGALRDLLKKHGAKEGKAD